MATTPFRRSHIGIISLVVFTLVATILANSAATPSVSAEPVYESTFLNWEGEPFSDGLNHFLVTVAATDIEGSGWLRVDHERLVAAEVPPSQVGPEHIESVLGDDGEPRLRTEELVAAIAAADGVSSIKPIAYGIYAVAGSIGEHELAELPGIETIATDPALDAATVDPYFPTQWGLDNDGESTDPWAVAPDADIDAPEGWHRTRGDGVVVAVIDSGADISHPDLITNIWRNPNEDCGNGIDDDGNGYIDDCSGWDFANGVPSVTDYVGHGTHVAGIIAAEANNGIGIAGVAHEAEVMVLKIGDGTPALSAAIEAIAYAVDNGAKVINASWVVDDSSAASFLDTAIGSAGDDGVLFVTAAGNEPRDIDADPIYPASSTLDNVLTVGASTPLDEPADWSGYGATNVDIFAPGDHIISTVPGGYGIYSGTSMAAPMVSAAAALLLAATPEATYGEVKGALLDRSDGPNDGVTAFRDLATSDGRLNIDRSIYAAPLFRPGVMYEFHEFNSFEPGTSHNVSITAKTVDPWLVPPQTPTMYRAGLYVPVEGQPMAVVGQEITYTGDGEALTVTTDNTGRALVGTEFEPQRRSKLVQSGDITPLTMQLPAGTYAFIMEIVDITSPDAPVTMGDPSAVFFIVDTDGSVTEMPQIPIGGNPAPATTTSAAPQTTTTTAPSTTAAPTTVPSPTTTTLGATTTTTTITVAPAPTTTIAVATTTTTSPVATTTTIAPVATTTTIAAATSTTAAPPPATTTTTLPGSPTTTTTSTVPTTIAPDGPMVTGVNPAQGPTTGHTLVTITGKDLPELADVYFGERSAEIVSIIAPTFIVVDTPPGAAGWVDVKIVDRGTGASFVLSNGFLYTDDGQEPPPSTTTSLVPGSTTTTITSPATTAAPTTTTLPSSTTLIPVPTTTANEISPDDFGDWRDSLLRTPEGLTLAPPAADDRINSLPLDLWVGTLCDQPICPGWVLEG
ncbi:MAG: S8 family serine peptidase [bacterium]|nr:S8 family serine peptidase [bacterium]